MRRLWCAILLSLFVFAVANVQAADVGAGKAVFDRLCMACHGPAGVGASGPALNTAAIAQRFDTPAKLRAMTQRGAPGMPAFGPELLKDADLDNLSAYLLSLAPAGSVAAPATAVSPVPAAAAASPVAAATPPLAQAAQPAQSATQDALPLTQIYALAVFALAAINVVVMLLLWMFVNRKPMA